MNARKLNLEYRLGVVGGQRHILRKKLAYVPPPPPRSMQILHIMSCCEGNTLRWYLLSGIHSSTRSLISQSQSQWMKGKFGCETKSNHCGCP